MKEFQRNLNAIVIHNSKTDLDSDSSSNLLIVKVIIIVIYYTDLGGISNSIILITDVLVSTVAI